MIYPTKYGYRVSVEILRDAETDHAQVKVYCPIYVKKEFILSVSFTSSQFTDSEILKDRDFNRVMMGHFGTSQ